MRNLLAGLAAILIALSLWALQSARAGLVIQPFAIPDGPPATLYLSGLQPADAPRPVVVIAHGFAGSRQLMESYAVTLARAGYAVVSFDFMGHGRNPRPMSGDVTRIDGTTRLLVEELRSVARAARAAPFSDGRLAYLGHSMASDIIIRAAQEAPEVTAVVAISAFSQAVTATRPANLLLIAGAWEAGLIREGERILRLSDPLATPGSMTGDFARGDARRLVIAPAVEHVGVLYSRTALAEARAWLDASFARPPGEDPPAMRGGWILLLLAGLVLLAWPLARSLPAGPPPPPIPRRTFLLAALLPALVVPLLLAPIETKVLPVLVADYLVLHFAACGLLVLLILWRGGHLRGQFPAQVWPLSALVALFGIGVIGTALDSYVASFFPHAGRALVISGLALGAVPLLLGDALLGQGGHAPLWRTLLMRGAFLASLLLAVALDFDRLMFLLIILPVILLFYLMFGTMSGWIGRRTGLPAIAGIGIGLILAWALGVTFPLFA